MTFSVPVVDIGPLVRSGARADGDAAEAAARADVADRLGAACAEVGFVQVVGHGIAADVIAGLAAAIDDFFALPLEEKKKLRREGVNRGYTAPKSESLSLSLGVESANRMNDFFEAFNVGRAASDHPDLDLPTQAYAENSWPPVARFQERVSAYFAEAGRVARVLVRGFADAWNLPADYFDAYTSHSLDVLRMNNYALPEGTEVALDGDLTGMGEHTDYGIVTVLWADQVAGLQVLGSDGEWHEVLPEDGALLVNLGDLTARWTNERWLSTLHRVKPPLVGGTIARRRSAAYFHDGNIDAVIAALPGCVDADHPALYPPITVGEHIAAKLAGSRAGVSNPAADREAARVLSAR